ncbi:hypothetical protein ACFV4P_31000 [Kitasatospora sp. NPDC059795]|uniref:hypothetical protein n=1 Tax=Kitasatospora sp. NPDC059795 TaxID=3346949 RepID=UPI003658E1F3
MTSALPVVDVDDPVTWPAQLADLVTGFAQRHAAAALPRDCFTDTDIGDYADLDAMAPLLAGHLVRARHCTRLLDHEADSIREHGLLLADGRGVADRLARAADLGHLTTPQYTALKDANLITRKGGGRKGFVFLTLSGDALAPNQTLGWRLRAFWGGEAVYQHWEDDPEMTALLRSLGRPAVVTALLDLADGQPHSTAPSLAHVFLGRALGETADATVHYMSPIPSARIESVAFPGDPAFDRLGLPGA